MPKISALPPVVASTLTDLIAAVQLGVTTKQSLAQVLTLFQANVQITESQVTGLTADLASKLSAAANLSDLASASTARTNLGLGTAAVQNVGFFLQTANNLSDIPVAATARTNLGLGSAATQNITFFLQTANNLSDLASASTARTNLGLGTAATHPATDFLLVANNLSDVNNASTALTNLGGLHAASNLSDVASASTSRTNLGLGTAATHPATDFLLVANNLSDLANAGTARTNLGLGTASTQNSGFFAQVANNLSDLANAGTARTNLGLGTAAVKAASGAGGTVASVTGAFTIGHVATFADTSGTIQDGGATGQFLLAANNLSDVASASTSRTNLGLGTAATHAATDFLLAASNLSDLGSATTARSNLGLGTAAVQNVAFFLQTANNLSDVVAATARTNLGLGTAAVKAASGAGGTVASVTGSFTAGHVAVFADTSGTIQDGGAPGTGTVNSGLINQLGYYAAGGTAISGLTTGNNGVLVTSAGGVPSISSTLPSGLTIPLPLISGIINGSQAATGNVGQVLSSVILNASATSLANATTKNITSLAVPAGNWYLFGNTFDACSTAAMNSSQSSISTTTATQADNALTSIWNSGSANTNAIGLNVPGQFVTISGTTTYYLVTTVTFSAGTASGCGGIYALRIS